MGSDVWGLRVPPLHRHRQIGVLQRMIPVNGRVPRSLRRVHVVEGRLRREHRVGRGRGHGGVLVHRRVRTIALHHGDELGVGLRRVARRHRIYVNGSHLGHKRIVHGCVRHGGRGKGAILGVCVLVVGRIGHGLGIHLHDQHHCEAYLRLTHGFLHITFQKYGNTSILCTAGALFGGASFDATSTARSLLFTTSFDFRPRLSSWSLVGFSSLNLLKISTSISSKDAKKKSFSHFSDVISNLIR